MEQFNRLSRSWIQEVAYPDPLQEASTGENLGAIDVIIAAYNDAIRSPSQKHEWELSHKFYVSAFRAHYAYGIDWYGGEEWTKVIPRLLKKPSVSQVADRLVEDECELLTVAATTADAEPKQLTHAAVNRAADMTLVVMTATQAIYLASGVVVVNTWVALITSAVAASFKVMAHMMGKDLLEELHGRSVLSKRR